MKKKKKRWPWPEMTRVERVGRRKLQTKGSVVTKVINQVSWPGGLTGRGKNLTSGVFGNYEGKGDVTTKRVNPESPALAYKNKWIKGQALCFTLGEVRVGV